MELDWPCAQKGKRDGPAGRKSGAQRKIGLVGERQLQAALCASWRDEK